MRLRHSQPHFRRTRLMRLISAAGLLKDILDPCKAELVYTCHSLAIPQRHAECPKPHDVLAGGTSLRSA